MCDGHILRLIKALLVAPVEDDDGKGGKARSRVNRDNKRGTPQGSPISPLMSNLYMRRFILGWRQLRLEQGWSARIVNYAERRLDRVERSKNHGWSPRLEA